MTAIPPPESHPVRAAALVVAVGVTCALHIGKLPVAIPALQTGLGVSLVQAGFLLSLVQLAGMALGLFVGLAADRIGPRRIMLVGLVALALGSAWGATAGSPADLLASRALEGLGFLLAVLPAPGLIRRHVAEPRLLAKALGWWGAYMPLGTALALLFGAPVIEWLGWRAVWLGLTACSLLALVALWRGLPSDAALAGQGAPLGPRLRRTLGAPGPWLVAVAFFLYSGQWLAVVGFLPTILAQAGVSGLLAGLLSAAAAAVNMGGNIGAGRWIARGGRPRVVMGFAYIAMGLGALLAFGLRGAPVVQYLAVLAFSGLGGLIPGTLFGLAVRLAPGEDTISTTVGWMQQLSALGQFVGPPFVAWVATQVGGWQLTWVVTGAASLLGLWVAHRIQRTLPA
ncbi:MAG: MFS transporter [Comamonadaceae bacterium]|jgi:predicted MFS family arabinose efflux permease|uniref:MFS transporter n=1 Tax=Hydrogenophaga sp. SNF1 TaxID=3098762 RepID=UPI002ACBF250|nr:MFS transporter [Hydrogenophaga sp. SNF1]NCT96808.1 MFS transporter [Comamonadaceae bacterium]WQB84570.1 MFS transporter [Hydrogenophaga sp. SNF1]